ncbi:MAG: YicC family protein [Treponema sp.]|jgi:uncharacterized protein (TIGR00255 family)|nr:YicC family protein [Treponema sp.]
MTSMTGFAFREKAEENSSLSVEIKGYNSRFLEIYVNTPPWLSYLEPKVRQYISAVCGRGKVEVSIRVRESSAPVTVLVNIEAAKAYRDAIMDLAAKTGTGGELSLASLIAMEGVLDIEKNRDDERYWAALEPLLRETVEAFNAERIREGKHTEADILNLTGIMERIVADIGSRVPAIENSIKENIKSRFAEVLGNQIDENRILAETAVLLVKYTISEELSRLSSHLAEFRCETAKNPRPGKKLDFLCQEINREINTIGSKSAILEVSRAVVEMKEALENVREQLRNVE